MQKWEYLEVVYYQNSVTVNDERLENPPSSIHGHLNQFGEQGWELVTFYEFIDPEIFMKAIFKRPKS